MKVLRVHEYGGALQMEEIDQPKAGPGQVVVRNQATSLNPIDPGRASGVMREVFPVEFPWIPGGDISGVVESVGEGVTQFKVGDEVFGYAMPGGAYAEYVAVDAGAICIRPAGVTVAQGAAVAMVGQTAMQALELAKVGQGQNVLIHAGSGGVGSLAIQLAHVAGAHVITTARAEHKDALLKLGADRVIDFTTERFEDAMELLDAVLDLVGGETLARSYGLIKHGGIIVTANQPPDAQECEKHGIQGFFVQTKVTTEGLQAFADLVVAGKVTPLIAETGTLWDPESIWSKRPRAKAVGKVVFSVA